MHLSVQNEVNPEIPITVINFLEGITVINFLGGITVIDFNKLVTIKILRMISFSSGLPWNSGVQSK